MQILLEKRSFVNKRSGRLQFAIPRGRIDVSATAGERQPGSRSPSSSSFLWSSGRSPFKQRAPRSRPAHARPLPWPWGGNAPVALATLPTAPAALEFRRAGRDAAGGAILRRWSVAFRAISGRGVGAFRPRAPGMWTERVTLTGTAEEHRRVQDSSPVAGHPRVGGRRPLSPRTPFTWKRKFSKSTVLSDTENSVFIPTGSVVKFTFFYIRLMTAIKLLLKNNTTTFLQETIYVNTRLKFLW